MVIQDLEYLETVAESQEISGIQGGRSRGGAFSFARSTSSSNSTPFTSIATNDSVAKAWGKATISFATGGGATFSGLFGGQLGGLAGILVLGSSGAAGGVAFAGASR